MITSLSNSQSCTSWRSSRRELYERRDADYKHIRTQNILCKTFLNVTYFHRLRTSWLAGTRSVCTTYTIITHIIHQASVCTCACIHLYVNERIRFWGRHAILCPRLTIHEGGKRWIAISEFLVEVQVSSQALIQIAYRQGSKQAFARCMLAQLEPNRNCNHTG